MPVLDLGERRQSVGAPADRTGRDPSAAHVERALAARAVAVDREVVVERGDTGDAEALHHGKTGAIDDREALIGEQLADPPCGVEVAGQYRLDRGQAPTDAGPEALCH